MIFMWLALVHFQKYWLLSTYIPRESKLSSFHLEFSFNSIRYICLLFYCLVTFGFLWHKFCFKKIHWSDNSLLQVKSTNAKNFCKQGNFNVNKEFLPKKSKTITRKCANNFSKIPKILKICIQFPTSHLEAENPFGLVFFEDLRNDQTKS